MLYQDPQQTLSYAAIRVSMAHREGIISLHIAIRALDVAVACRVIQLHGEGLPPRAAGFQLLQKGVNGCSSFRGSCSTLGLQGCRMARKCQGTNYDGLS